MSTEMLLEVLVSSVGGATGAMILVTDGEAVEWYARDVERLRLRGAYLSVALQACRSPGFLKKLGGTRCLILEYERTSLVAQWINEDSFIALELAASANIAGAVHHLGPVVEKLRIEFG